MCVQGTGRLQGSCGAAAGPLLPLSSPGTGSGSIDADELRTVLQSCLRESAISLPEEKLDQLTLTLFQSADKDGSGAITFDELRDELQQFPGVMENLTIRYSCGDRAPALPARGLNPGPEQGGRPSQRSPACPFSRE